LSSFHAGGSRLGERCGFNADVVFQLPVAEQRPLCGEPVSEAA
jgi:hypothetical protein